MSGLQMVHARRVARTLAYTMAGDSQTGDPLGCAAEATVFLSDVLGIIVEV